MVYDFQAGGFSPLINPVAINKSTKQQESPYGDTHSLLQGAPYAEKKRYCEGTPCREVEKFPRICILSPLRVKIRRRRSVSLGLHYGGSHACSKEGEGSLLKKMVTLKLQAITSLNPFVNFHFVNENIYVFVIKQGDKS